MKLLTRQISQPSVKKTNRNQVNQKKTTTKNKRHIPQKRELSLNSSDSDDISLGNSRDINENYQNLEKDESISSSVTLISDSEDENRKEKDSSKNESIAKFLKLRYQPDKTTKKTENIEKNKKKDKNLIKQNAKIQQFLQLLKSIKSSKRNKKYVHKNPLSDENKPAFSSLFEKDPKKDKTNSKPKKTNNFPKLPIQLKPSSAEMNDLQSKKFKKNKKKVEVFLDGQLETELVEENDEDELSLNDDTAAAMDIPKRRQRRTKKEMELYKILQKAINFKNEQEHQDEDHLGKTPKKDKKVEECVPTSEKKKRRRRTKQQMAEFRAKQAQLKADQGNENDFEGELEESKDEDLDAEFHKNEPKKEFRDMINKEPTSDFLNPKKARKKRKSKEELQLLKEKMESKEKVASANPEFEDFLTLAPADVEGVTKKIKKKMGRPRKDAPKKEKDPNSELKEKVKRRNRRGGLIYYAPVFQKWERYDPKNAPEPSANIKEFEGTPGIKLSSLHYTTNPYDFFSQFLPEFMFEEIAKFTNISAIVAKEKKENPQTKSWYPCYGQEIKDLFALFFLFELIKKNNVQDYWTDDPLLNIASVEKIMSEERFFLFKKFLSFYDKSKKSEYEKEKDLFYKCKFLVGHILEACSNIYTPEKYICLQEVLVNYEGITKTNSWERRKQRGKNEINIAVLKEANSGYIWNVLLNEGNRVYEKKQLLNIINGLEYKGYTLYMDSCFTSVSFLTELKNKHIAACGITTERNLKPPLETKKEIRLLDKPGETGFFKNKDLTVVVWNHQFKKVFAMSNFVECQMVTIKKSRKIGYFSKIQYKIYEYEAPKIFYEIIENLKGNDYVNKGVTYYSLDYSSWKWYYRVMLYFLEMCMMNSYLLYSKVLKSKGLIPISNLEYRIEIIKKLCRWNEKNGLDEMPEKKAKSESDKVNNENNEEEKIEEKKEVIFDDVIINNDCNLVYIGVGFCHYCRKKRFKLKKTFFWCRSCRINLCIKCFDQHKTDQIIKRMKDLEPTYMKNLIDLLIFNKNIEVSGVLTNISGHVLTKRFRRTRKELILKEVNESQKNSHNEKQRVVQKEIFKLKRKRKPYKKRKNKLLMEQSEINVKRPDEENIYEEGNEEEEKMKKLERDFFDFSDDSLGEKIKRKSKQNKIKNELEKKEEEEEEGILIKTDVFFNKEEIYDPEEKIFFGDEVKLQNDDYEKEILKLDLEEDKAY